MDTEQSAQHAQSNELASSRQTVGSALKSRSAVAQARRRDEDKKREVYPYSAPAEKSAHQNLRKICAATVSAAGKGNEQKRERLSKALETLVAVLPQILDGSLVLGTALGRHPDKLSESERRRTAEVWEATRLMR